MNSRSSRSSCAAVLLFLFLVIAAGLPASETAEVWSRLYRRATNLQQKYTVMQNVVEQNDASLAELISQALEELNRTRSTLSSLNERETHNLLSRLVINGLANLKAREASAAIFSVVKNADDPLVVSEALVGLGRLRATEFEEPVILMLKDLNLTPPAGNAEAAEIRAYGCVSALEKMKSKAGYKQVFLASVGWYSVRIKNHAARALPNMSDDPTEVLASIVLEAEPEIKLAALAASDSSRAETGKKAALASKALEAGLRNQPKNPRQRGLFAELRTAALISIIEHKHKSPELVLLLQETLALNYDMSETLNVISALGSIATDEATKLLGSLLDEQNRRQAAGISASDNRYPSALIRALGRTRNALARPALLAVNFSNYTPAMEKLSEEALKEVEQR